MSDHEAFFSGPGLTCVLRRAGDPERNGVGALREIRIKGVVLTFDRRGELTRVEWRSIYHLRLHALGALLERVGGQISRVELTGLLKRTKRILEV